MTDTKYWVDFSRIPSLGTIKFRHMEGHFGSLEQAWASGWGELEAAGIDEKTARTRWSGRAGISPDAEMAELERAGVKALTWGHSMYPPRLIRDKRPSSSAVCEGRSPARG